MRFMQVLLVYDTTSWVNGVFIGVMLHMYDRYVIMHNEI